MTSGLRKVHKIAWLLIAIVGIIFLFFTIRGLNFDSNESNDAQDVETSLNYEAWD